eukprot:10607001-Lingulodinium_polyedra.AAC.1
MEVQGEPSASAAMAEAEEPSPEEEARDAADQLHAEYQLQAEDEATVPTARAMDDASWKKVEKATGGSVGAMTVALASTSFSVQDTAGAEAIVPWAR